MPQRSPRSLDELESDLFSSLKPINPNPQFVNNLQERLVRNPRTVVEDTSRQAVAMVVLVAFLCGMAIIIVLRLIWRLIQWLKRV